jgi:flagellar motor switch protein FliM
MLKLLSKKFKELPMLESLLGEITKSLQEKFIKFLLLPVELKAEAILSMKACDYPKQDYQSIIAVEYQFYNYNCESFFIFIDRSCLYKMIEITLGGQQLDYSLEVKDRQFSKIEEKIIEKILSLVTEAFDEILTPLGNNIKLIQKNIFLQNFIPQPNTGDIFLSRATITIKDLVSTLDFLLPYDSILPIKSSLIKGYSNHHKIQNKIWEEHMKKIVSELLLNVEVKILLEDTTINNLSKLKVGTTLITRNTGTESINITVEDLELFKGKLGSINDKIAIEIV